MENLKKFKKEIAVLTFFTLIMGATIIFFLHQKNVEGDIFIEKVQKETENNKVFDNGQGEVDINADTTDDNTEVDAEEICLEDMNDSIDTQNSINTQNNDVINDNSSAKEEEVIEGSWLHRYTVTPEILKEYSISWESGNIKNKLNVEQLLQNPELPSGCEVTSLTVALNYLGYDIDKITMCDTYLDMGAIGETNPY